MRKIIVVAVLVAGFALIGNAQFKFGAGGILFDGSFGVQAKAHNGFSETIAGQGTFSFYFESGVTLWSIDLDGHYTGFSIGDLEGFRIAPFAGLNILRASGNGP